MVPVWQGQRQYSMSASKKKVRVERGRKERAHMRGCLEPDRPQRLLASPYCAHVEERPRPTASAWHPGPAGKLESEEGGSQGGKGKRRGRHPGRMVQSTRLV